MSRGLGRIQRRVLDILTEPHERGAVAPTALDLGRLCQFVYGTDGKVRVSDARYSAVARAVRTLARQGLLDVARGQKDGRQVNVVMRSIAHLLGADETLNSTAFSDGVLVEGDCRHLLARVPDSSVAMAYLDPPYNLQLRASRPRMVRRDVYRRGPVAHWDVFQSFEEYDAALEPVLGHLLRVLQPHGSLWVSGTYHCIHRLASILQDMGAWFIAELAWWRPDAIPPLSARLRPQLSHESLLWLAKDRAGASLVQKRYSHDLMVGFARRDFGREQPLSVWRIPTCRRPERLRDADGTTIHPTQKPVELVRRMVQLSTLPGELILDPMAGTGTTGAAAQELGRRFLLMEREPQYVEAAAGRLAAAEAPNSDRLH